MTWLPDDLALFQYYKGIGIGVFVGLGFGWLFWRLPTLMRNRQERKLRKQELDVRRILAGFNGRHRMPNSMQLRTVHMPLWDRVMEWWQSFPPPRTPEQVAREAYERELSEAAT